MTLTVGVVCPWPAFADRLRPYGLGVDPFVVLATESRWSTQSRGVTRKLHDKGKKLYKLDERVAAAFAGDVTAGHDAIRLLERKLRQTNGRSWKSVRSLAEESVRKVYRREQKNRRGEPCGPLHVLVSCANEREGVDLFYCGTNSGFRAKSSVTVETCGDQIASKAFRATLTHGLRRLYEDVQFFIQPSEWGCAISASVDSATRTTGETVGGKVQLILVTRSGCSPFDVLALDAVGAASEADIYRKITVEGDLVERPKTMRK